MSESDGFTPAGAPDTPIFVTAMLPHCGANIVVRALLAHRETTALKDGAEDFLLSGLEHLEAYWRDVETRRGGTDEAGRAAFGETIAGLLKARARDAGKRVVSKASTTLGLPYVRAFFPDAPVIAVIRSGPEALQALKGDPRGLEALALEWKAAAEAVLAAEEAGGAPIIVLRYEDVVEDPAGLAKALAAELGLSQGGFDHAELADLDGRGPSARAGDGNVIHWTPAQEKPPLAVDAVRRGPDWTPERYRRFDELTGGLSAALGYELPYRYEEGKVAKFTKQLRRRFAGEAEQG